MRMTLVDLRSRTMTWIASKDAEGWIVGSDTSRIDAVLNEAYQETVNTIDAARTALQGEPQGSHTRIVTSTTQREYPITRSDGKAIRGIVEAYPELSSNVFGEPMDDVPYKDRNRADLAQGEIYYFRTTAGLWYVGFLSRTPHYEVIWVATVPVVDRLVSSADVPVAVMESFHETIALTAAVMCKIIENRDPGGIAELAARRDEQFRRSFARAFNMASRTRSAV